MNIEAALSHLDQVLDADPLNSIHEKIFRLSWDGKTYEEIATLSNHDTDYIRHLGQQLWQKLSTRMAQRVTKRNLQVAFRRYQQQLKFQGSSTHLHVNHQILGNAPKSQNGFHAFYSSESLPLTSEYNPSHQIPILQGRYGSIRTLDQWISGDRCRLITLLGMGGIGKTTLARHIVKQVQDQFEVVVWRSLRNTPSFSTFIETLLKCFPRQIHESCPNTPDAQIAHVLTTFQEYRSLLVLDNFESVLEPQALGGQYHPDHQAYGHLLRVIADETHQSCLLLTSRENPVGLTLREGHQSHVRSHQVSGLATADAQQLLLAQNIEISEEKSELLAQTYGGNPFALKTFAASIQSLCGGKVSQCIDQTHLVFGEIRRLLAQQIQRLTPPELQAMTCIARCSDWILLDKLQDSIVQEYQLSQATIWDTILSLQGRSLIQTNAQGFNVHPYLRQYLLASA